MKLLQQAKPFSIFILPLFFSYTSLSQAQLVVDGAKINMANSVVLSTGDISASANSLVNVDQSTIKIAGSTASAGAIDARNGTAELNGSAAQQIAAASFNAKTVKALTINNTSGATVNDTLNITDVLTVSNGNLISQGFLTLKSNESNTARVAPVTSAALVPISGDVIVERFVTPKRAVRFLTAPVNASTNIRTNWMEGVYNLNTSGNNNPVPNFGTHITGAGGHLNRFDETITNNPSLFTFNNQTQNWVAATNTDTLMKAGQAFRIMVRGSRSTNLNSNTAEPSPTTLRAKGELVTGTVVLKKPGDGGTPGMPDLASAPNAYSFIANPYASPVDWLKIDLNDISSSMYIFDPTISGSSGRGSYVSFNRSVGSSGVSSNPDSKIDNNIQSGQAFFVLTTGASPSVTFKEIYKTGINRPVFRTPNIPNISLQLLLPSQVIGRSNADALSVYFSDHFSSLIGEEDSYKFTNQDENIAILRNGKTLSIEGRKPVTVNDTIPLKIWQLALKNYFLKIALQNFDENVQTYLEDSYLHTSSKLSDDTASVLPFAITADPLSVAPDRFRIVFKPSTTLPLYPSHIKAYVKNKGVEVEWLSGSQNNIDKFEVEKSANAEQFVPAGVVKAKASAGGSQLYNWFDPTPFNGNNYYRIKHIDKSGEQEYSRVAKLNVETAEGIISIVSNEADRSSLTITFKNVKKGKYASSLINNTGQKMYSGTIDHAGGSANSQVKLRHILPAGLYHMQISGGDKNKSIPVLIK